ncbi:WD40 repeat protein [Actinoplanes tereljensis]|uniref:WD40 repeat protein n=1 Tax=Paractinoplanes tereljensis TaxID=571912 RepID=A0A919NYZ3_9ACTN|nr:WD40 repeat domain-containing protein [Actinoplanes tereljensis]GIF26820.1 hypothetical protein Ate02nite_95500 [Actinoplanes tereljensis]
MTTGDDGTVRVWNLRARIQQHEPINGGGPLGTAALVADEPPLVAAAVRGGPVQVWTLDGQPRRPFAGHEGTVTALRAGVFDGVAVLVSAGTYHTVRIWDPRTNGQVAALTTQSEIRDVALLHDGHRHLVATAGDRVELWDPRTGEKVATLQSDNDSFATLTVLPGDGEHPQVAVAGRDSVVCQWDVTLGRSLPRTGHTQTVTAMAAGRMGDHIVILSGARDETIRLWDAASDLTRPPAVGHHGDVNALAVHRGHAFSAADDGRVAVWELATGARPRVVDFADWPDLVGEDTPFAVAYLADGDLVVAGGSHGTIAAWSLADGSPAWSVTHHRDAVNALATVDVADGQLLISGGDDQTVRVWNPSTQQELHILDGHTDWVTSLSTLVVDGRPIVASGGNDGAIRLWDAGTGDQLGPALLDDADCINAVVLAEVDGRLIVAGAGDDHLVRVWDAEHGKILHRLDRHTDEVHALALLPGPDPVLVSGGNDRTLRLWHPLSGRPLGTYHLPDAVRVLTPADLGDLLVAFGWEVALLRAAPG